MTRSTGAPTACPRCGLAGRPHHVARHAQTCFTPRTIDRLAEIGKAVRTDDGCLLWRGRADRAGIVGGVRAYVVACEITHGPRPDGHEVLHACDQPGCFEPTHVRWGTHAENLAEMHERGRARGLFQPGNYPARWLTP